MSGECWSEEWEDEISDLIRRHQSLPMARQLVEKWRQADSKFLYSRLHLFDIPFSFGLIPLTNIPLTKSSRD